MVAKFLDLNITSATLLHYFAFLDDGRKALATVLFLSAILHEKVIHVILFSSFEFSTIFAGARFAENQKFYCHGNET